METLIIHIPESKSVMVKSVLQALGVSVKSAKAKIKKPTAHDFLGLISAEDAKLIDAAIVEGCEQVNEDDWK